MTTIENRPNTALVVVDVQNSVVSEAWQRDQVVSTIAGLVDRARQADVPVIWVQDHTEDDGERPFGSDAWQIVPELQPREAEPRIAKTYGDSFEQTDLEQVLDRLGIGHLVVTGAQTDACIRATLHGAFVRGYDTTLVSDAHTTEDLSAWGAPSPELVVAHTNLYWNFQDGPGRAAAVVESGEVEFGGE
ncbi:MAG: isochorismatase family protein [Propionicimonas sp.]